MRPPSYYTSIAQGNERNRYSSSSSSSSYLGESTLTTSRTSSQQLRSSLAACSSSSYVNRSHLPYVAQTTLVAHCFTGVGSSTRPYGSKSSSSSSSYLSSRVSSASNYLSSSRPLSKRLATPYNGGSNSSSGYSSLASSSSYLPLRASAYSSSSASRYTAPSYYKPIRLRERPILAQISSRLSNASPVGGPTLRQESKGHKEQASHSSSCFIEQNSSNRPKEEAHRGEEEEKQEDENDWSQDVARNISRNKYLIKFREFDKPNRASLRNEDTEEIKIERNKAKVNNSEKSCDEDTMKTHVVHQNTQAEPEKITTKHIGAPAEQDASAADKNELPAPVLINDNSCDNGDKKKVKKAKKKEAPIELKVVAKNDNEKEQVSISEPVEARKQPYESDANVPHVAQDQEVKRSRKDEKSLVSNDSDKSQIKKERRNVKLKLRPIGKSINKQQGELQQETKEEGEETHQPKGPVKVRKLVKKSAQSEPKVNKEAKEPETAVVVGDKEKGKGVENLEKGITKRKASDSKLKVDTELASIVKGRVSSTNSSDNTSGTSRSARIRFRDYYYDDFNFLTVLGHGGWGFVILAELKDYDACFAVKCIKKITIVEDDDYDSIMIERKVLSLGNINPFICKLFCTFETNGYLFFVMEYCAGGDLMFHVQREGKFTESRSRFYAAEIICAIRFLHNRHIIYRDLKLDNILLDSKGHIRLVDFGMCQCRTYREEMLPSNFCGTPEYISPEIIKGVPYNHSVDWWSFGVLLYEMAVGKMPFRGNDENELLWNVCYEQIHYPMYLTKELTDLLKLLLEREPTKRMGMATCKAGDIYDQPFFRGVNWKAVEELKVEPPFVPEVTSKRDVQNFDSDFTESACELSPVDDETLNKIDQSQFSKFPYTNPDIFIFEQPQAFK